MNAALDQLDMFTGSPSKRPRAVHVRAHVRRIETPAARSTDPQSSHDAADLHTASGTRQRHIEVVIDEVRAFQGLTSAEIAARTGLERHEAARRLPEAVTAGAVRKGLPRVCTISGKRVTTWWSAA